MDRRTVEARLEEFVTANRFVVAVVFPLVGGVLLVASGEGLLPPQLSFNPYLLLAGTLVMRLPLAVGLLPLVGRRGGASLGALTAYTYAVELAGVHTGLPYGEFAYGVSLGPMVAGVPVALPVFFFPLVVNAYLLVLLFGGAERSWPVRLLAAVATVLAVDLVLDPAAVSLGFWSYAGGGRFYGVPWTNYAGWLLSAAVAVAVLEVGFDAGALRRRLATCPFALDDLVSFVLLWGTVNAYFGNWVPVAVAAALFGALAWADRFDFSVLRSARYGAGPG